MVDSLPLEVLLPSYDTSLRARGRSDRTREIAATYSNRLVRWLQSEDLSTDVDDIDHRTLERYFVHLGTQVSATTTAIHYRTLRALFGWLTAEEEIDRNPFKRLRAPKADEKPVPVFTEGELRALLDVVKGRSFEQRRDRAILLTLIDTGLRAGELLSLTVHSLDHNSSTALVSGKTGSRIVPFGATAWEAIDRYLRSRRNHPASDRSDRLWIGSQGQLTASGVAQMLTRRGKEAGVEGVRPHKFRHSFCHAWLHAGGNEGDLQQLAGWTSSQMIARYGRSAAHERAIAAHERFSPGDRL